MILIPIVTNSIEGIMGKLEITTFSKMCNDARNKGQKDE